MTTANLPIRKPTNFNPDKGKIFVEKLMRESTAWIKEMAKK